MNNLLNKFKRYFLDNHVDDLLLIVPIAYVLHIIQDFTKDITNISIFVGNKKLKIDVSRKTKDAQQDNDNISTNNQFHALWVDDNPENTLSERNLLQSIGFQFSISTSTHDALEKISQNSYHAIVSDMGRPPDKMAGYTLLKEIQSRGINTPFIIYSTSNSTEHKIQAMNKGAFGSTNDVSELIGLLVMAINKQ